MTHVGNSPIFAVQRVCTQVNMYSPMPKSRYPCVPRAGELLPRGCYEAEKSGSGAQSTKAVIPPGAGPRENPYVDVLSVSPMDTLVVYLLRADLHEIQNTRIFKPPSLHPERTISEHDWVDCDYCNRTLQSKREVNTLPKSVLEFCNKHYKWNGTECNSPAYHPPRCAARIDMKFTVCNTCCCAKGPDGGRAISKSSFSVEGRYDADLEKFGKKRCAAWLTMVDLVSRAIFNGFRAVHLIERYTKVCYDPVR